MAAGNLGAEPVEDETAPALAHDPVPADPGAGRSRYSSVAGRNVLALVTDDGTVAAWTRGAEELVGIAAADAVGERAAFFLGPDDGLRVSAFADRLGSHSGWSNDVRTVGGERCSVRISRLSGSSGESCWLMSAPTGPAPAGISPHPDAGRRAVGVAVFDLGLRCILVNDVVRQQAGTPQAHRLGHRMAQVQPGFSADALEAVMLNVLRTGAPALDYRSEERGETNRSHPRTPRTLIVSLFQLLGADGAAQGVCSLEVDITGEHQARERLAVLGEASAYVGTTDDIMRTSQELADFAVPRIADYTTVDLAESVRLGEEPLALLSPDAGRIPVFHRAGVASIHPDLREALFERGHPVFVPSDSPFTDVLTTGRSHFQPILDATRDAWFQRDPDRARVVKATGMHTLMIIPVREGDAVLGIAVFVRSENPEPFDEDDLRLAEELVAQAARRLKLQRAKAHDRATALALQRNLLPQRLENGPGIEVNSHFEPADAEDGVGGDWFDVIACSGSRTGLVVGDVVGHGIGAAAAMGRLRTAIRTFAYMDIPPDELLARVDHVLMSFAEGDAMDEAATATSAVTGATCLCLVYDPHTHRLTAASAGHPPPAIVSPEGAVTFPEIPPGAPLGYGLSHYEQVELDVAEGSLIALYTDGLVQARGADIDVGIAGLAKVLARPVATLNELCVAAFDVRPTDHLARQAKLQLREPTDDATLLLARILPTPTT